MSPKLYLNKEKEYEEAEAAMAQALKIKREQQADQDEKLNQEAAKKSRNYRLDLGDALVKHGVPRKFVDYDGGVTDF